MTVETIARADTPHGEIALRRRGDVVELIVNGVFAMDTLDVTSEHALADAAGTRPGRVLVGGLGLGFTACRLLDRGAAAVDVVELAEPLLAWAREGVTERLGRVALDNRVKLHLGDIVEFVHTAEAQWDAILLDVDNGPTFLIHEHNRRVYAEEFLRACLDRLTPDGMLVVWCETASPGLVVTLRGLGVAVDVLSVPVTREGRELTYLLYRVRRPPSADEAPGATMPGMKTPSGAVIAVSASRRHEVRKQSVEAIELVAGHGVLGDAHAGATVQHLHAQRKDPATPNLRQVHLIGRELLDDLARLGQPVDPGELGENVLTAGVELLSLPVGTRLRLGRDAVVRLTGKRDPCSRINVIRPGLMKLCFGTDSEGRRTGRIGVLGVVEEGGTIRPGDAVLVEVPAEPHLALEYV